MTVWLVFCCFPGGQHELYEFDLRKFDNYNLQDWMMVKGVYERPSVILKQD